MAKQRIKVLLLKDGQAALISWALCVAAVDRDDQAVHMDKVGLHDHAEKCRSESSQMREILDHFWHKFRTLHISEDEARLIPDDFKEAEE